MNELRWEQHDLDVLVKKDNKATFVTIPMSVDATDKFINIVLEDADENILGTFTLNSGVSLEMLEKAVQSVNIHCEILKQEKIEGYKPKFKVANYNKETKEYEV